MPRVNFFPVTSALYIYRVHDRGCTCTIAKPKKHWLHFLHRRPVDPYASRRYHGIRVYTSWYRVSGIMAVPRPAVDSFLPNFTHRYTATRPLVAYTPPQHSRQNFPSKSSLLSILLYSESLFFVPSLSPFFFFFISRFLSTGTKTALSLLIFVARERTLFLASRSIFAVHFRPVVYV